MSQLPAVPPPDTPAPPSIAPATAASVDDPRQARRVVLASSIGTTIEFYDFGLYGFLAGTVFGPLFFPSDNPVAGQLGALATFAAGFLARPVGGMIAGHFGDRVGRKRTLIATFLVMGVATTLIGLLPTYQQIGVLAPVLLVLLRLLQGLAAGAEWGGALLMAVEHAPARKRGLYGAAPMLGVLLGAVIAQIVVLTCLALSADGFLAWGWRIAFGVSFVLIFIGVLARRKLAESPLYEAALANEPPRVPLATLVRGHTPAVLRCVTLFSATAVLSYMMTTYMLSYGTTVLGYGLGTLLTAFLAITPVSLVALLGASILGDRWGRRRTVIAVGCVQVVAVLAFFPLFESRSTALIVLALAVASAANFLMAGPASTVLAEQFPTEVRYTGVSVSYGLAYVIGGLAPLAATSLFAVTGTTWWTALGMAALAVLAIGAMALTPGRNELRGTGT
jgi:MFS family permease